MRKLIGIVAVLMLFCLTLVSAGDMYSNINLHADRDLYTNINLNGQSIDINIDGVDYKGYVDYKVEQRDSPKTDVVKMFDKVTLFMVNPKGYLSSDFNNLAFSLARLLNYVTADIYNRFILPMSIKQNAIIATLDQEVYCSNLAQEYFEAFDVNEFKCLETNKTYYKDLDVSIKVGSPEFEFSDEDWATYVLVNYTEQLIELENYIIRNKEYNKSVVNVTGKLGLRDFICYPTNETTSFGSRVFDCEWTTNSSAPIKMYEEAMVWDNKLQS